jgi:hypothetical protein
MTDPVDVLDRLAAVGAVVEPAGNHLILHAGATPVSASLVRDIRRAKVAILAALAGEGSSPTMRRWWRDQFEERAAHRELDGGFNRRDAELLAYDEIVDEWLARHRPRAGLDAAVCAGCGEGLAVAATVMRFGDDACVHLDPIHGVECAIRYSRKQRAAAIAGLRALGLSPPAGYGE